MLDKKNSLYQKSNKLKKEWTQGPAEDCKDCNVVVEKPVPVPVPEKKPIGENVIVSPPVVTLPAESCYGGTLAMAFVNMQKWDETYEPSLGFERGTMFPDLDLPFVGEGACRYE